MFSYYNLSDNSEVIFTHYQPIYYSEKTIYIVEVCFTGERKFKMVYSDIVAAEIENGQFKLLIADNTYMY